MNELEKLREEMNDPQSSWNDALREFKERTNVAMNNFLAAMERAREIERQAGIYPQQEQPK